MKKTPLAILLILITLLFAEKNLIVHTPDGPVAYPLTSVDSLTIEEYTPKIGPFESTWWTNYTVSSSGDNYSEVYSSSTYPATLYHNVSSDMIEGLQVKGTRGLGQFVSLKITYTATSEVLFGGLTQNYDFIRGKRLPATTNGEQSVYVFADDFNSSLTVEDCRIFEFKFSDYETTSLFKLIDFEVIQ